MVWRSSVANHRLGRLNKRRNPVLQMTCGTGGYIIAAGYPVMPPEYPMPLKTYLQTHFVTRSALAELCEVSAKRLDALIASGAAPQPTYVCGDGLIRSAVFGALPADTGIEGEYFRPEYVRWIQIADSAPSGHEREALVNALSAELEAALATALGDDTSTKARAAEFLPFFFDGTFGLCVADPSSGAGIAKKELLQEQLGGLGVATWTQPRGGYFVSLDVLDGKELHSVIANP